MSLVTCTDEIIQIETNKQTKRKKLYKLDKHHRGRKTQIRANTSHITLENRCKSRCECCVSDPGVELGPLRNYSTLGGAQCFAQRHYSKLTVQQILQAADAGRRRKLSSPLTSQGQPKKTPPKTIPFPQSSRASGRKNSRMERKEKMKERQEVTLYIKLPFMESKQQHRSVYSFTCGNFSPPR